MAGTERELPVVITVAETPAQMRTVIELRRIVFGNEQRILLSRYEDPEDHFSLNLIASIGDTPVGTGRITPAYDRAAVPTITWVATLPAYRNRGVGSAIVQALIDAADARGYDTVYLNAQAHALGLYLAHGFRPVGQPQTIHGIPHQAMIRQNPNLRRP
jgi:predicted GNAT family N-acyltransferase